MPAKHNIDQDALSNAADLLFTTLGTLDDLPADLSNTVANIYYRVFWYRAHARPPTSLSEHTRFMEQAGKTLAAFQYIDDTVKAIRDVRHQSRDISDLMASCVVDEHNYRIRNAVDKSAIRRAIERWFSKAHDLPGLYDLFCRTRSAASNLRSQ